MKKICFTLSLGIFLCSCRHEPVIPDQPQVSFANDVNPIISGNCTQSGCHGGNDPEAFSLDSYDKLMKHDNVVAGKPHSSKIYESITKLSGEDLMPRSPYPRLSNQQIETIYLWILQGAKNN